MTKDTSQMLNKEQKDERSVATKLIVAIQPVPKKESPVETRDEFT
jgi:hypothetical protein